MKKQEQKEYILEYNMLVINIFSFVLLGIMILITYLLALLNIHKNSLSDYLNLFDGLNGLVVFTILILWMVLHEIIHGIAYQVKGAKKNDIVYGASIENGVFYCKAKEYINKKCIITSLLSPLITIGIITYIIGILTSNALLISLSSFNISGAAGDIAMYFFFRQQKEDILFRELGFSSPAVIKTTEDITAKKYFGIKNVREVIDKKEITEAPEKKITISKGTRIFIIIMIILFLAEIILTQIIS